MSKEVTYSVVARKNMLKKDDPAKYYAQAQALSDVNYNKYRHSFLKREVRLIVYYLGEP
jgi:hypothetical protein